jgi:predicted molibdopterin-dependent oxidoreductase YjgC
VGNADLVILVGVNLAEEQPVLANFVKRAVKRNRARVLVINPRRTEDAGPGLHLAPYPGTEGVVLNGLMALLAAQERFEKQIQRVAGGRDFQALLRDATPQAVAALSGIPAEALQQAAALIAGSERPLALYGPDVVRGRAADADANAAALANLEILVGRNRVAFLGSEGNSQGARDMGVLPTRLPGHAPLAEAAARERLQRLWGSDLPAEPGLTYSQMLQAAAGGTLKALFVMGADPASEGAQAAAALEKLDFLIVQDVFLTETAQRAHVVLPATTYAETDGTFTNLERRVQRAPQAFRPYQQARPDWKILVDLARKWPVPEVRDEQPKSKKVKKARRGQTAPWSYASPQDVLAEIARAVPQYAGLTWEALGEMGKQWSTESMAAAARLVTITSPILSANPAYPFRLAADRLLFDHGVLTRTTERLQSVLVSAVARLNPADLARLKIREGSQVQVTSAHGGVRLLAQGDPLTPPGVVAIAYSLPGAPAETLMGSSGPGMAVNVTADR